MASSSSSSAISAFLSGNRSSTRFLHGPHFSRPLEPPPESGKNSALLWKWKTKKKNTSFVVYSKKRPDNVLQYRKLGDSDLVISEITLGTMTFGEQNTEKEAHEQLSYAIERGINTIDTSEMERDQRKDRPVYWKLAEDSTPRQDHSGNRSRWILRANLYA